MTDVPLFDLGESPKLRRVAPVSDKPRWSPLTRRTVLRCADCVQTLHDAQGIGPLPLLARYTRTANGIGRPLCSEHADHWRELDKT